jgi:hypothetical protein
VSVSRIGQPATQLSRTLASIHHWQGSPGLNPREILMTLDRLISERLWDGEVGDDGVPMTLRRSLYEPWPVGLGLTAERLERLYKLAEDADVDPELVRRVKQGIDKANELAVARAARTHCIHGHEFTDENTFVRRDGSRICRACKRDRDRSDGRDSASGRSSTPPVGLPEGGSGAGYLRARLARDRPDLYAEVLAGDRSPAAAAVEAGIRPAYRNVRIDSPANAVKALLRIFTADELRAALDEVEP